MAPSAIAKLEERRQRRPHPYPVHQRFPPTEDADSLPEQIQAGDALGAAINLREFMFIVLLLVLRLFVAIFLHGNAIRALTENAA
ncbi:hypothetical protein PQX77_012390 [Marasmius sp. AFHP31]|nr:hypothetical protein PQX77_013193 [Marasmius sp. AFHP31]KAK1224363.1 hypothetical protein PQX77_012747 [Marasmius sp. AFHP31]KAK1224717.1 hypothetical protein PQX77_012390 [Marasmius sp. AFHP31]